MLGSSFSLWYAVFSTKFHEIRNQNFTVTLVTSKSIYRLRVNNFYECVFAEVLKKAHRVIQHAVVNNFTFFPIIFSKKMNCAWRSSRFVNKNIVTTQWHVCRRLTKRRPGVEPLAVFSSLLFYGFFSLIRCTFVLRAPSKKRKTECV